jgi:alpha-glucosidase
MGAEEMPKDRSGPGEAWWRDAVIYEIAAISFQDSNGDGYGDLPGLLQRIDYLKWLGVGAVWLTPICTSPNQDFGYDISDFCAVDPRYGTMEDFEHVRDALHANGIKLILDFVPNHTSDQHAWFLESRTSRDNPKADWYVWAEAGPNGGPPNNWLSRFGGSAWEWCEARRQFYYHSFLTSQPDLNWRNKQVRQAMADTMRFWLDRGVVGFRVDASAVLIKDNLLRDNPADPEADDNTPPPQKYTPVFTDDRPETIHCIEYIRGVLDEYDERLLCGEVQGKTDRIGHFYGNSKPRLHLPLNFALLDTEWNAFALQATIDAYFNAIPDDGWPDFVIGGHDKHRVASKLGQAQSRILAMLLMTIRGTPFLFAGDEIGSEQVKIPRTAAIPSARRSVGMIPSAAASRPTNPGCRSAKTVRAPLRLKGATRVRCCISTASSLPSGPRSPVCCTASIGHCARTTTFSGSRAALTKPKSWSVSTFAASRGCGNGRAVASG